MSKKNEVEALLFSSGKAMELEDIAKICRSNPAEIQKSLDELKEEYEKSERPLLFIQDGTKWKLTVRENYSHIVEKVVTDVELTKTLIETLAVIAWKTPVLQSDIIKVRTNKAYEHIKELEESGFVSKKRHGRSYMLGLAQKFYDYFDLQGKDDLMKKLDAPKDKKPQEESGLDETKAAVAKLFEVMQETKEENENPPS